MRYFLFLVFFFLPYQVQAESYLPCVNTDEIPQELKPWIPWVLKGKEDRFCPSCYDNGDNYFCSWSSRLTLDLGDTGGRFVQQWTVFRKSWVDLPGTSDIWPEDFIINGKKATVLRKGDAPAVVVEAGVHTMEGKFTWSGLPEMLSIPAGSGIINLTLNGRKVDFPVIDQGKYIWLQKQSTRQDEEDKADVLACRLVKDTIPLQVVTRVELVVAGKPREIVIPKVVLPGLVPMEITSRIPARLNPEGGLLVQAIPGRWDVRITARSQEPVYSLGPVETIGGQEIWSFDARNDLRMVRIEGVAAIDPGQTDLPDDWKTYPAYVVNNNNTIIFKMLRRGDPDPAPDQLRLKRVWWLDFDGRGYTVQDTMTGAMSRQWYLAMNPPGDLGHVAVDGIDRLITSQGSKYKAGVELRKGYLNLMAESRYDKVTDLLPAVGWNQDIQSLEGVLNLPPGWRLLGAAGADDISGTWISSWTLLDVFLVLIIALAIGKLWNMAWGLIALVTLTLIFHETGSPRLVWLHLLASIALVRFIPDGLFKRAVSIWGLGAFVTLVILSVPFMVGQVRMGFYPQLEPLSQYGTLSKGGAVHIGLQKDAAPATVPAKKSISRSDNESYSDSIKNKEVPLQDENLRIHDPNALIQTGPGLPDWSWKSYPMKWSGPVDHTQTVSLWLLPPWANLLLAFIRVILLAFLIIKLVPRQDVREYMKGAPLAGAFILALTLGIIGARDIQAADAYPSQELLKELEQRLLRKPDCYPACAQIEQMHLEVENSDVMIRLLVHAAIRTAVPLPSSVFVKPSEVTMDTKPCDALLRDKEGIMWVLVPEGVHTFLLTAKTPPVEEYEIMLPLKPHRVTFKNTGWDIRGIGRQAGVQDNIKLVHLDTGTEQQPSSSVAQLFPFLSLERRLSLGFKWQVMNTMRRLTPKGSPVVVDVHLLAGESVTTPGISVEGGMAHIQMSADQEELSWISSLPFMKQIILEAPVNVPWTEEWVLDASPVWHCELSGIPVIHYKSSEDNWNPRWMPWPGERVQVTVSRPPAKPGKVLTIEEVRLTHEPGQRLSTSQLDLRIRSSQGTQHKITIPGDAGLEQVTIMGREQPIRARNGEIILPIKPGIQDIHIRWHGRQDASMVTTTPGVTLGRDAVNTHITLKLPRNRWVLFAGGPRLGPAVLFWSYLFVVIIISFGLGQVNWTPLKRHQWFLLGLGLTQVHPALAVVIVGWLLGLGLRERQKMPEAGYAFNLVQISLAIWTLVALAGLYLAIQRGLLGIPDMQVAGNDSTNFILNWTQDRIARELPQPWVLSLPLMVYRVLMLLWALWIAVSLLKWLKWGWECCHSQGLWKEASLPKWRRDAPQ